MYELARVHHNRDFLTVTEGIFDALRMLTYGYAAVALLGKAMSVEQATLLGGLGFKEIVLCLDSDAISEAFKAAIRLSDYFDGRISVVELHTKDPDKTPQWEMAKRLDNRVNTGKIGSLKARIDKLGRF